MSKQAGGQGAAATSAPLWQFIKFGITGVLNTGIDFLIFNGLQWMTGITLGWGLALINVCAFGVAVVHSYVLNKYWTFKQRNTTQLAKERALFVIVSLVGVVLNTGIVYAITTFVSAPGDVSGSAWANVAKVCATGVVFIWNFVGYKYLAFRV